MKNRPAGWLLPVYRAASMAGFLPAAAGALAWSRLFGKGTTGLPQRLGSYGRRPGRGGEGTRLWIHAASVGEAEAAGPIAAALRERLPGLSLVVSAATVHGHRRAREIFAGRAEVVFAPLDFIPPVRRALDFFRPQGLVLLETELWPNWICEAAARGMAVALVNGRISARSVGRYESLRALFGPVLEKISAFSMIAPEDAHRVRRMGAPAGRISIAGNAKYDGLAERADPALAREARRMVGEPPGPVFAAGSTRGGEEEIAAEVFARLRAELPGARMILAPRHVERADEAARILSSRGLPFERYSLLSRAGASLAAPVLLVDIMGPLFSLYATADFAFLGGSLVRKGGHNVLEPAAWGKPVLFGPHTEDFSDAAVLLEKAGGGIRVRDASGLARAVLSLARAPEDARERGRRARRVLLAHQGAAARHAAAVTEALRAE